MKKAGKSSKQSTTRESTASIIEYGALPAIDHSDPAVQSDAKGWLSWLKNEVGFDVS